MGLAVRPRRSVLYMPASNARALAKGRCLPCDAIIMDLEDAVAPEAKQLARDQAHATLAEGGFGRRELVLRINALTSPWGARDLPVAAASNADAILLPKVSHASDITDVRARLDASGSSGCDLWAMMETPLAMLNAGDIAAVSDDGRWPLTCFVMGTNDLVKETGARFELNRVGLVSWLSTCVAAAKAYGVAIVDGVYNDFRDIDGLTEECVQGRALGMDGKTLIHPGQIDVANQIFAPSAEQLVWARRIVEAYRLPENQGQGAINLDGRMVERLHADIAERDIALADAIAQLSTSVEA